MGMIFHKGTPRATAPTPGTDRLHANLSASPGSTPPSVKERIKISSEPPAATKASRKAAKKSQKAIEKSGINDPAYREASAKRGEVYKEVKAEEDRRLDINKKYKMDDQPTGIEKAYLKGGFEGVEEHKNPTRPLVPEI